MLDFIKKTLLKYNIELVGALKLCDCRITRPYKLRNFCESEYKSLSAIVFAVPYLSHYNGKNISAYAVPRDYHLFFKRLFTELTEALIKKFDGAKFECFADNSPIDERHAAALCGLGMLGDNGLLITEKYSSYVFLGEIITDYPIQTEKNEIKYCLKCGKCQLACPMSSIGECLSSLTQKKGELTANEANAIKKYGSAWGCDICQEICPFTLRAKRKGTIYTEVDFFNEELIPILTSDKINEMSEEEFSHRAYSWRGRGAITRNLKIMEDKENQNA